MRFEASQQLRLGQHMKLAPKMIQSMEILQLSMLALEERIEQELEANVALETVDPVADEKALEAERREVDREDREGEREFVVKDGDNGATDFERLDAMTREYGEAFESELPDYAKRTVPNRAGERDAKLEAMANTAAPAESLTEQLLHQWMLAEVEDRIRIAGDHLITYIDDDGYLRTDLETMADQAPTTVDRTALAEALKALQGWLEPTGIAAHDLQECLLLQLDGRDREDPETDRSVERLLITDFLGDIEANRLPRIAQKSGIDIEQIKAGLDHLRNLDPRPGRMLAPESPSLIVPDAIVEYDEDADVYVSALFDGRLPRLRVNPEYQHMAKDRSVDPETRQFVDSNVRDARWLIEAIDQRCNTLLRVINAVVAHQRDYFDQGSLALKPLPMTQVADQLGVHVATVSRAVSGKWIQTPRGVLPLRRFFTAGTETEDGRDMSWDAVKETLREIIEAEDKMDPMGDDKLSAALQERGIKIARRTVAKYRDQLGIPSARLRKQF